MCLKQNEIAPSRFAQIYAKERKKTFKIKQQQNIVSKYGEAKILKEYLKGEVENVEDFK